MTAGEHLSYDYERIVSGTARELAEQTFADLAVMLAENPHPIKRACAAPSLADGDFLRGKAPMTKEEVRALVISKLHLAPDHTVWDVGAGTGSVSVEAALADNDAYHALKACDGLIVTGPTGTNVNDLSVALIGRPHAQCDNEAMYR